MRAFTLIELIIVLMILGITTALAAPMLSGRDDVHVEAIARRVTSDLQYAQNLAVVTQRVTFVRFEADRYVVLQRDDAGELTPIRHPIEQTDFVVTFGQAGREQVMRRGSLGGVSFEGGPMLAYDSLGSPMAYDEDNDALAELTAPGTVRVTAGEFAATAVVTPYTGEVQVIRE